MKSKHVFFDTHPWLDPDRFESDAFDRALERVQAEQEVQERCLKSGFISASRVA